MRFPPFFASDEEADRAYIACGKVALNWGPIELHLEAAIVSMRYLLGVRRDEKLPVSFSKKSDELKLLLRGFEPISDAYRLLLTEAKRVHGIRSKIVHSLCQGTNLEGELMFGHSSPKEGWGYTELKLTIPEVEKLAADMRELRESLIKAGREAGFNF